MMKRLLFLSALYLTIGAIITVATSWAIAAWMPMREFRRNDATGMIGPIDGIVASVSHGIGWTRRGWEPLKLFGRPSPLTQWTDLPPLGNPPLTPGARSLPPTWPAWGSLSSNWSAPAFAKPTGCEHATGWPFRSFWYEIDISPPGVAHIEGGIPLRGPIGTINAPFSALRAIPLRPIGIGLVLNTLFWACVFLSVFLLTMQSRATLRLRRNHCPRCNYNLSASPTTCPECGWNRSVSPPLPVNSPR